MADAGTGIKNLAGFGATEGTAAAARTAFAEPITTAGLSGLVMGGAGLADLEAQQKALDEQKASGAIGDAEYATAKASIDAQIATASKAVSDNPFSINPDRSFEKRDTLYTGTPATETLYAGASGADVGSSKTLYAVGGSVDDESGLDEARGLATGNMQNGFMGGGIAGYAAGGVPRFLSGGGDGMSDSIPATIEGKQPARLADGEFVIPADVVSSLGNGSNDSGAEILSEFLKTIREHKRKADSKKLPPDSKGALGYLTEAKKKVKK